MREERLVNIGQFRKRTEVRHTLVSPSAARVLSTFISVMQMKTHFGESFEDELMSGLKDKLDAVVEKDAQIAIVLSIEEKKRLEELEGIPVKSPLKRVLINEYQLRWAVMALDREFFVAGGCHLSFPEAAGGNETSKGVIVDFNNG